MPAVSAGGFRKSLLIDIASGYGPPDRGRVGWFRKAHPMNQTAGFNWMPGLGARPLHSCFLHCVPLPAAARGPQRLLLSVSFHGPVPRRETRRARFGAPLRGHSTPCATPAALIKGADASFPFAHYIKQKLFLCVCVRARARVGGWV